MALLRRRTQKGRGGMSPTRLGAIAAVIVIVLTFIGWTKINPFSSPFEMSAVFKSANNLQPKSPVREAGVNVGIVRDVQPLPGGAGARVTMTIEKPGLPIHKDAVLKIRPRIFLEGNFFVDVQPGSPSAPTVKEGDTIPVNQTATPVQFGEVLTALQADTRQDLRTLLNEYAIKGFGNGGATAYNQTLNDSPQAFQQASIANNATLGQRPATDVPQFERGQQRLSAALNNNPQILQDLVDKLNTTAGAFAAQDVSLARTISDLNGTLQAGTPALQAVNNALPSVRTFARTALGPTRSSLPTLNASTPLVTQLNLLFRKQELRGLAADLRVTIPALARVNHSSIRLLAESRTLSACQNNTVLPFSKTPIPDPDFPANSGQPFYKQSQRTFVGLASEGRTTDANTPYIHGNPGSGATTIIMTDLASGNPLFAQTPGPPQGVRPAPQRTRPVFRPGIPCETQVVPDLNAPGGPASSSLTVTTGGGLLPPLPLRFNQDLAKAGKIEENEVLGYLRRHAKGQPAVDPWSMPQSVYLQRMKQLGLGINSDGNIIQLPGAAAKQGAGK